MTLLNKPMRFGLAFLVVAIIFLITEHPNRISSITSPIQQHLPDVLRTKVPPPLVSPPLPEALKDLPEGFVKDAHRLKTADEFLPHFEAVTQMKGLTLKQAMSGCQWGEDEHKLNFQYADNDWIKNPRNDSELADRREQWRNYIKKDLEPYGKHKHKWDGRGIVIVAGNQSTLKRVHMILKALAKYRSKLPVEIHYWAEEMDEARKEEVRGWWPIIYFNDLSADSEQNIVKTSHDGFYINYNLKTAAILNSRFAEPLLLDSDNLPVIDPEDLYESGMYREYGTLFWPDIARTRPVNPIWPITNTQCRMNEYEQESGQLLVDKHRFFYHLQLATWFNNEQGNYYSEFLLGDKDTFRFAWHALKTQYGYPAKWLSSVGTITPEGFFCGHSFAQHHPDGRVAFLHGGLLKNHPVEVVSWHRENGGGIFQVYKKSEYEEHHEAAINVGIIWDGADYLPSKPEGFLAGSCTNMFDIDARPLSELIPPDGFEQTFVEIGGYWVLDKEQQ